jgi:hypothetical protein
MRDLQKCGCFFLPFFGVFNCKIHNFVGAI